MPKSSPLLGTGPQGLALEISPWQTKESIDLAMLYRGAIVAGWAAVETNIIELAIRASRHPAYTGIRDTYPSKLKGRIDYVQVLFNASGPLERYRLLGLSILTKYRDTADLRNMMAHARMTVLPDWGATFYGFKAKSGTEITHYQRRFTEDEMAILAHRSARFARTMQTLMGRLEAIGLPSLGDTFSPPT